MTTDFMIAFVAMQADIPVVGKNSRNAHGKYNYTDLAHVCELVYPVLRKHGFAVSQVVDNYDGQPSLRTILMHKSGACIEGNFPISEAGMKSAANSAQQFNAAISYVRKFGLLAIVGAPTDDDDAESVGPDQPDDDDDDKNPHPTGLDPRSTMGKNKKAFTPGGDNSQQKQDTKPDHDAMEITAKKAYTCAICGAGGEAGSKLAFKREDGKPYVAHWNCFVDTELKKGE